MTEQEIEELKGKAIEKTLNYLGSKGVNITKDELRREAIISYDDKAIEITLHKGHNDKIDKLIFKNLYKFFDNINCAMSKKMICFHNAIEDLMKVEHSGPDIAKIMEKIQKLLAVTQQNGATENEAIIAATKAQRLMKQYDIEYANLRGEKEENIINLDYKTDLIHNWQCILASYVAEAYCCHAMWSKSIYGDGIWFTFRGYESDAAIARRMFVYLRDVAVKLGRKHDREYKKECDVHHIRYHGNFSSYCIGFSTGAGKALNENCRKLALIMSDEVKSDWNEYMRYLDHDAVTIKVQSTKDYKNGIREGQEAVYGTYIQVEREKITGGR